jgi:hypothetical protein
VYTSVNGINCEVTKVICGVPQGSVFGPLFFLYVNNIPNAIPGANLNYLPMTQACLLAANLLKCEPSGRGFNA